MGRRSSAATYVEEPIRTKPVSARKVTEVTRIGVFEPAGGEGRTPPACKLAKEDRDVMFVPVNFGARRSMDVQRVTGGGRGRTEGYKVDGSSPTVRRRSVWNRIPVLRRKHWRIIQRRGMRARLWRVLLGTEPPPTSVRVRCGAGVSQLCW